MRHVTVCWTALLVLALMGVGRAALAAESLDEFEGWHLEPAVGQAHLVMVARVAGISRVTVVEGAKTDVAIREYRFQPVRVLKGIFQRDELSMTADDLGISADGPPPLQEGEFRVLILIQPRGIRSYGCVSAAPGARTFDERVPLVKSPDDSLVPVVETLIRVADSRSRRERAKLLLERLKDVDGLAAVPLLSSLALRADWAAADGQAFATVARLALDSQPPVRGSAMEVLREMLAARSQPDDPRQFDGVAEALRAVLASDEGVTRVRLAALEALGHLLALRSDIDWARELLIEQVTGAATHAECAAAAEALAQVAHPEAIAAVLDALETLPLDEPPSRESVYARAAVRLDAAGAERVLLARLERSIEARQSLQAEIEPLGRMQSEQCLPLLLAAARRLDLSRDDRQHIARALGRIGDDRAVPVLADWLRGGDYHLKQPALEALETIDSQAAAREVRPLLKSEGRLPLKLRMARLLARHGLDDGYALATEHLADVDHTAAATLVLVALEDPRTSSDLSAIVAARPDRRWFAAALGGLAAVGDAAARKQLLDILANDRHPLAADAAEAAGLTADSDVLLPLAALVDSRNSRISLASLIALQRFLTGVRTSPRGLAAVNPAIADSADGEVLHPPADIPPHTRAAIGEAVASLAADAYVDARLRHEALAVARLLGGEDYVQLLSELADQAELEGTQLLAEVQAG